MKLHGQHFLLSYFKIQSVDPAGVRILDLPHDSPMLKQLSHRLFFKIAFKRRMRLFISKVNLERSAGQLLLTFCMRCRCCLYSRLSFCRFCLMQPLRRGVFHCEDSVTATEVDPWLGCHGYLLLIAFFADRLICSMAHTPPITY